MIDIQNYIGVEDSIEDVQPKMSIVKSELAADSCRQIDL